MLNTKLLVPSVGFSIAGLDRAKYGVYPFQSFLFIVVIVESILLKTTFSQISIYSQSLVKILWRSDKGKITFKAIEKYRYGLWKTISKHLNFIFVTIFLTFSFFSYARADHAPDLLTVFIACVASVETGLPLLSPPVLMPAKQARVFLGFWSGLGIQMLPLDRETR